MRGTKVAVRTLIPGDTFEVEYGSFRVSQVDVAMLNSETAELDGEFWLIVRTTGGTRFAYRPDDEVRKTDPSDYTHVGLD